MDSMPVGGASPMPGGSPSPAGLPGGGASPNPALMLAELLRKGKAKHKKTGKGKRK